MGLYKLANKLNQEEGNVVQVILLLTVFAIAAILVGQWYLELIDSKIAAVEDCIRTMNPNLCRLD